MQSPAPLSCEVFVYQITGKLLIMSMQKMRWFIYRTSPGAVHKLHHPGRDFMSNPKDDAKTKELWKGGEVKDDSY